MIWGLEKQPIGTPKKRKKVSGQTDARRADLPAWSYLVALSLSALLLSLLFCFSSSSLRRRRRSIVVPVAVEAEFEAKKKREESETKRDGKNKAPKTGKRQDEII